MRRIPQVLLSVELSLITIIIDPPIDNVEKSFNCELCSTFPFRILLSSDSLYTTHFLVIFSVYLPSDSHLIAKVYISAPHFILCECFLQLQLQLTHRKSSKAYFEFTGSGLNLI